jgi:hypothetical protein
MHKEVEHRIYPKLAGILRELGRTGHPVGFRHSSLPQPATTACLRSDKYRLIPRFLVTTWIVDKPLRKDESHLSAAYVCQACQKTQYKSSGIYCKDHRSGFLLTHNKGCYRFRRVILGFSYARETHAQASRLRLTHN